MKIGKIGYASTLTALAASMMWTSSAFAQTTTTTVQSTPAPVAPAAQTNVVVQPQPPVSQTTTTSGSMNGVVHESREEGYMPNRMLLVSGILVAGIPYVASVVTAASSGRSEDHHLYVPLAGPWLDLANRGGCPATSTNCDTETTNKVFLAVDGVFQAIGAIEIASAFLFPEKRDVLSVDATAYTPKMTFTPAKVGGTGYGFAALAQF